MLENIANQVELEFLEKLGIVVLDNNLVNVKTENVFYPTKTDQIKYGNYYFVCDNILIELSTIHNEPVSVNVWKDGLEYRAWAKKDGSRGVSINKKGDKIDKKIVLEPQVDYRFIKATITYEKEPLLDLPGNKYFYGSYLRPDIVLDDYHYGDLDIDYFRAILFDTIEETFDNILIRDEFHRFLDFFSKGFEKLLAFPVYNKDKFIELFNNKKTIINCEFADKIGALSANNDDEVLQMNQSLVDNSLNYISKVMEFEQKVKSLSRARNEKIGIIDLNKQRLDVYIKNYNIAHAPKGRKSRRY